jgi:RNA polymerase sigma factor (sigma-70 family)
LTDRKKRTTFRENAPFVDDSIDIEALKQGSEGAFRNLVEAYQDRVYNTCAGFADSPEEAEDCAQEVFVEVYQSIGTFRGDSTLATWIYRIAVTKSLEALRRRRRKKRFALLLPFSEESTATTGEEYFPLAQLEQREMAGALHAALTHLGESQRVAFTLHTIEGLPIREVSAIMNTSASSVESLIHRARVNLKRELALYYKDERRGHDEQG